MKKDIAICIRINKEKKELLKQLCKERGMTLVGAIRRAVKMVEGIDL